MQSNNSPLTFLKEPCTTIFLFFPYKDEVFGTAYMAALYVKEHLKVKGKVYLLGGAGLEEEFTLHGLSYIGPGVSQEELDLKPKTDLLWAT